MQNETETNLEFSELSAKEQRKQFETRLREAIKQSIPHENNLSVRMLNDMLDTFKKLCYEEGVETTTENIRKCYTHNFMW